MEDQWGNGIDTVHCSMFFVRMLTEVECLDSLKYC